MTTPDGRPSVQANPRVLSGLQEPGEVALQARANPETTLLSHGGDDTNPDAVYLSEGDQNITSPQGPQ